MTERLYHYSVIRYVPRPRSGEFVNIGVIAVSADGEEVAGEFTNDWQRARTLGDRDDIATLQVLIRSWKRTLLKGANEQSPRLFADGRLTTDWLERAHAEATNLVQLAEPHRGLATTATELVREIFDTIVAPPRPDQRRRVRSKRGLQLAFEGQLRRRGLGASFERGFVAPGAEIADWTFDYAIKNGGASHLVQTLNFRLDDVQAILADATYVAYAKHDLGASELFGDVPVSVLAEPPEAGQKQIADEARTILGDVPLLMRDEMPGFVERLATILAPASADSK